MLSYSFGPRLERPPLGRKFASRLRAPKVDPSRLASSTQLLRPHQGASSPRVCELQKSILLVWRLVPNSCGPIRAQVRLASASSKSRSFSFGVQYPTLAAPLGRKFASGLRAPKVDPSRLASSTQLLRPPLGRKFASRLRAPKVDPSRLASSTQLLRLHQGASSPRVCELQKSILLVWRLVPNSCGPIRAQVRLASASSKSRSFSFGVQYPTLAAPLGRKFASRLRAPKVEPLRLASSTRLSFFKFSHKPLRASG